jgi:hypothetical protein
MRIHRKPSYLRQKLYLGPSPAPYDYRALYMRRWAMILVRAWVFGTLLLVPALLILDAIQ